MPARAAAAATALARLPVEGQASTLKPISRAAARATATTRSLNEWVGLPLSSLTHSARMPERPGEVVGADQLGEAGLEVRRVGDVRRHRQQGAYRQMFCGPASIARGSRRRSRSRPPAGRNTRSQA